MLTSFYFEKANNGPTFSDYIKSSLSSDLKTIGSGFFDAYALQYGISGPFCTLLAQ